MIDEGEIIERGTHEELMEMGGFYYNLYMSQFKGKHTAPEPSPKAVRLRVS